MATTTLTYADMILLCPSMLTEDLTRQAQVNAAIQRASRRFGATQWGLDLDDGILYLAAHNLTLIGRADVSVLGGTGAISSRNTGESVTSYSAFKRADGYDRFRATPYGQAYLDLLFGLNLSPVVT